MQILDHEDERPARRKQLEHPAYRRKHLCRAGPQRLDSDGACNLMGERVCVVLTGEDRRDAVLAHSVQNCLAEWQERDALTVGWTSSGDDACVCTYRLHEFPGQPRLADARLADDRAPVRLAGAHSTPKS